MAQAQANSTTVIILLGCRGHTRWCLPRPRPEESEPRAPPRDARSCRARPPVLRLRCGDPDLACPDFSPDRRGLLFLSWNVWGLSSGEKGDMVHSNRLAEVRSEGSRFAGRARPCPGHPGDATPLEDDEIEVGGYRWFGRNRKRRKPSGGVGLLVCERLLSAPAARGPGPG